MHARKCLSYYPKKCSHHFGSWCGGGGVSNLVLSFTLQQYMK
jgi:hypothetical protein